MPASLTVERLTAADALCLIAAFVVSPTETSSSSSSSSSSCSVGVSVCVRLWIVGALLACALQTAFSVVFVTVSDNEANIRHYSVADVSANCGSVGNVGEGLGSVWSLLLLLTSRIALSCLAVRPRFLAQRLGCAWRGWLWWWL